MAGNFLNYEDLLVRGWGREGFAEACGSGVTVEKIARRLVSFSISARNLFRLWVETEMFRGGGSDQSRGHQERFPAVDSTPDMLVSVDDSDTKDPL